MRDDAAYVTDVPHGRPARLTGEHAATGERVTFRTVANPAECRLALRHGTALLVVATDIRRA